MELDWTQYQIDLGIEISHNFKLCCSYMLLNWLGKSVVMRKRRAGPQQRERREVLVVCRSSRRREVAWNDDCIVGGGDGCDGGGLRAEAHWASSGGASGNRWLWVACRVWRVGIAYRVWRRVGW
jgi:hypothetical protein